MRGTNGRNAVFLTPLLVMLGGTLCAADVPEGALVLFDGDQDHQLVSVDGTAANWPVEQGALVSTANGRRSNNLVSRLHFRNADLHFEFCLPRGDVANSGVFLHGVYEIQILTPQPGQQPTAGDMGGLYSLHAPSEQAGLAAGEWQTLDVRFIAPRRDNGGDICKPGAATVRLNGRVIHDHVELGEATSKYNPFEYDTTDYLRDIQRQIRTTMAGPLMLQDHDSPVRFRNIWVKPLDDDYAWYDAGPSDDTATAPSADER